jgi:hypothetical protein
MTTERWTDAMLNCLVSTVSNIADLTEQNTRSILQLDNNVDRLVTVSNSVITELQRQGGRNPRDAGRGEGPSDRKQTHPRSVD